MVGCRRCGEPGYKRRSGIYELMQLTEEIRRMMLRVPSAEEISRVGECEGVMRPRDDGLLKATRGMKAIGEALRTP